MDAFRFGCPPHAGGGIGSFFLFCSPFLSFSLAKDFLALPSDELIPEFWSNELFAQRTFPFPNFNLILRNVFE